ncbi:hypothetical protein GGH94_005079 [Coemansia aciculifera]|uniref:G-patch domain-containing protein n=1 Tax=Coemansia aciculifera TaxID=417176 RepID=A0A9W8IGU9_9FUNG|nr:hypothetical protein GGH94_005079 [Coemansia aciculifera]KAJ2871227.1 hypothetical protein GGH93_004982 [Coemansia aciculifera]
MPPSFEDELNDYVNSSHSVRDAASSEAVAPDTSFSASSGIHSQLPSGYEISADPQYAYNQSSELWLDIYTGIVSYYDPLTLTYVPVQAEERPESGAFDGVVRLVVVESDCYTAGQVVDINVAEGLDIGRDRTERGVRNLRIPDIGVSRFHAKFYADSDANTADQSHVDDLAGDGSEDGEIEEPEEAGVEKTQGEDELSDGECQEDAVDTKSTESSINPAQPKLFIVDQGSTHGTFVNGNRLSESKTASKPFQLQHLDQITIGQTTLQLHIHEQLVCAKCRNSGNNEINTYECDATVSGTHTQPIHISDRNNDLQKARIDNLKAIKSKYMAQPARETKPGSYVDRAMLRRRLLGSYQQPVLQSPPTTKQVVCSQPPDSQAPEPITESNPGYSMLKKMGWVPGAGLGASKEGIVDPIEIEGNADRVGLGAEEELPSEKKRSKAARVTKERFYNL